MKGAQKHAVIATFQGWKDCTITRKENVTWQGDFNIEYVAYGIPPGRNHVASCPPYSTNPTLLQKVVDSLTPEMKASYLAKLTDKATRDRRTVANARPKSKVAALVEAINERNQIRNTN